MTKPSPSLFFYIHKHLYFRQKNSEDGMDTGVEENKKVDKLVKMSPFDL